MIKKKMQMGGELGAFNKLKGAAKKKELEGYKNYGDGPGSGPSIDKTKKPAPKPKAMVGMKKAQDGTSFAKLAPPYDKATYADKIAGATKGKAKNGAKMKMGGAMAKQAAVAIAMKKAGKTPKKKMQYGGEAASMAPIMKKGGMMKKCKSGCK